MKTNLITQPVELQTFTELDLGAGQAEMKVSARFVRAGRLRAEGNQVSNMAITVEALQSAHQAGLFDGRAVFLDHSLAHSQVRDLLGVTQNSHWNEETQSVDGEIVFFAGTNNQHVYFMLKQMLDMPAQPDVGLSIVFWPVMEKNGSEKLITGIRHVESVDVVFEPAADGRILQALSTEGKENEEMEEQAEYNVTPTPAADGLDTALGLQDWKAALARQAAATLISQADLPPASKKRLAAQEFGTPAEVEAAIKEEHAYLAALAEEQVVQLGSRAPRESHVSAGMDGLERLGLALEALLQGRQPAANVAPLTGIREAYIALSGDYEMTGMYRPDRISLANVNSSTMAGLVANVLNKTIINAFQQYPRWWEKIVVIEDFASLQDVKWITLGGVGELPTVAEGGSYTELTWDDNTETAAFVKKGGYLGLTLEAIDKDDTRRLAAAPRALAQAAWLTLSKSVSSIFTSASGVGPTMADSVALFDAGHSNLGTTALSLTEFGVVRTAMRKQTELNSGERLGALTAPKFLLVPPDLELTALQVLGSESSYTYSLANGPAAPINPEAEGNSFNARMLAARDRVIVVDLWTDTNNWAAVADPMLYPSIGLGFRYGRTPEIFSVASPTAGLMFSNDVMPIKVRWFFAVGPTDYRGLYKENVA